MRIFLSWSGELSREVAELLNTVLPCMMPSLKLFMSKQGLESGVRWGLELSKELEAASFGILSLAPDNLSNEWLLYEAGALTRHLDGRACGLLLKGLTPANISGPLAQFQHRAFSHQDLRALVRDINARLEDPLDKGRLDLIFDKWWPDLKHGYEEAITRVHNIHLHQRDPREILEEILLRVRSLGQEQYLPVTWNAPGGGEDVLTRPVTYDSLGWYTLWKFPGRGISSRWQARLLNDIDLSRYPTVREIDDVVNKARNAVLAYSQEVPEVFRYGTDFLTKSLGFIDEGFRQRHGFGQRSQEAFLKLAYLVAQEGTPNSIAPADA